MEGSVNMISRWVKNLLMVLASLFATILLAKIVIFLLIIDYLLLFFVKKSKSFSKCHLLLWI